MSENRIASRKSGNAHLKNQYRRIAAWPNSVAIVPGPMKRYILRALNAGADDGEIAEATGLDCEQVTAIRSWVERHGGAA